MPIVFYIANLLDAIITLCAVRKGWGWESNIFMRELLEYPFWFMTVKTIVPIPIALWLKHQSKWFKALCAGIMVAIVIWNLIVVILCKRHIPAETQLLLDRYRAG